MPHILEHTTLCGSKKYPVRDPFFKMLNRSTASYMNAWTASDWTMYPFSSENKKDIENLRSVYLDACFNPLLRKMDFKQEGWRLEHEDLNDPKSRIIFKGVVYNEMKGAFSDSSAWFCQRAQQHLLKGTAYENVSGGDPEYITDLTHELLVEFHRKHYHPSNGMFYSYGNGYPLEQHLSALSKQLEAYEKIEPSRTLFQAQLTKLERTERIFEKCQPDPMGDPERQGKLSVSFITNEPNDHYSCFVMKILSYLLVDGQASPMFKALIDTNLGSDFTANTGYDSSTLPTSFSVGLQGLKKEDFGKVEETIMDVLEKFSKQEFDMKRVEAVLHQIELNMKNKTSSFGLGLAQSIVSAWSLSDPSKDIDLSQSLKTSEFIERLRLDMKEDSRFFNKLVEQHMLNNNKLVFGMEPSAEYIEHLNDNEAKRLKDKVEKLSDTEKTKIFEEAHILKSQQETKTNNYCLPLLNVHEDIPKDGKSYPIDLSQISSFPVYWRKSKTNGITYFKSIHTSSSGLETETLKLLPLVTNLMGHLGTSSLSPAEFEEQIRQKTGGIHFSSFLSSAQNDSNKFQLGVSTSGYCLDKNLDVFYDLLALGWNETDFPKNVPKVKTLITSLSASLSNSVSDSGHRYAMRLAASKVSAFHRIGELQSGLTFVEYLNQLTDFESLTYELDKVLKNNIKTSFKSRYACIFDESQEENKKNIMKLTGALGNTPLQTPYDQNAFIEAETVDGSKDSSLLWLSLPFNTSFSAKAIKTVPVAHPDAIKLQVLAKLMTHYYLHREIREKGGAYGGGCAYSDGMFSFYSYRDPNPSNSVETYRKACEWVQSHKFTEEELNEAKLTIFGQMDAPISASSEGMAEFSNFITPEIRQKRRQALMEVTLEDVNDVARKYLSDNNPSCSVVLAPSDKAAPATSWVQDKASILA